MGVAVLVIGHSGTGKSTSLRNFEPNEVGIFNVTSKPLPFRKPLKKANRATYGMIRAGLERNDKRVYVIDDANYLMAMENFARAKESGFAKFTDMACNFEQLLEAIDATDDDTIVYVLMHPDFYDNGRMKPKTIGRMLDEKLTVEGMVAITLVTETDEDGYHFVTNDTSGQTCAKTPMGMFESRLIDNDLKAVDTVIREYYGMKASEREAKKDRSKQ